MFIAGEKYRITKDNPCSAVLKQGDVVTYNHCVRDDAHAITGPDGTTWWVGAADMEVINNPVIVEGNPLYHYRASEETGADAWSTLVKAVAHHTLWHDVKECFKGWEEEYKITTGLPVPAAWRSAKSVIKGAFNNSVPLMNGEEPRGKTAVEKDIKAAKDSPVIRSPQDQLTVLVSKAAVFARQNGLMFKASTDDGEWQTS